MDLSGHVFLPKEDYYELQAASWAPRTTGDRIAGTAQSIAVLAALSGAAVVASWGVARARNWIEQRRFEREQLRKSFAITQGNVSDK